MATNNGEPQSGETSAEFELPESMTAETEDGRTVTFKLVGVLSDEETSETFAIWENPDDEEFLVTDGLGNVIEDRDLASDIVDDFLEQAEEAAGEVDS